MLLLTGVLSTTFTITNKRNYTAWPAIDSYQSNAYPSTINTTGFSLEKNESKIITAPASWSGRIWGHTYCTEDSSGNFSRITGYCGSGKLECSGSNAPPTTLAEFTTGGYLNESCPSELKVTFGSEGKTVGCRTACQAYSYAYDAANSTFSCASTDYQVTFCPGKKAVITGNNSRPSSGEITPSPSAGNTTVITANNSRPPSGEITPSPSPEIRPNIISRRQWVPIIAGPVGGVLAIISFVVIIVWRVRRSRSEDTEEDVEDDHIKQVPGMPVRFSYEDLRLATDDFKEILGKGGFGSVFKGVLADGTGIAVKRLDKLGQGKREFVAEVESIGSLHHFNLVRLIGFCAEKSHRLLVHEYLSVLSTTITITNNCKYTVWPVICSYESATYTTGFSLAKNESKKTTARASWSGRIWGRTYCSEDSSGNFSCITGDCGSGKLECSGSPAPPVTMAELSIGGDNGLDYFDVNLVDGFNLPLVVVPSAQNCTSSGCFADLNESCPSELQVTSATEGKTVGCRSMCQVTGLSKSCCNASLTPSCSLYSRVLKDSCPRVYSYSYSKATSTLTCASTNYQVTFCPVNTTVMTPKNSRPTSGEITPSPPPEIRPHTASKRHWAPIIAGQIIAGLVGGVLAIISFVVIIIWRVRGSRSEDTEEDVEDDQINQVPGMPIVFSYEELRVATDNFKEILGRGGFGQESSLDWQTRKKIILHIAKGLAYLHEECRQTIMHLDIKPQNILLDPNFNAKISDFGLSKLIDREMSQIQLTMRGTPGYLAPEWHQELGRISVKVDIYSFGIVLLEVVCARKCVDHSQPESAFHLLKMLQNKAENIWKYLVEYMQSDREEIIRMIKIAAWCLQDDPESRPPMSTVVKVLEGVMEVDSNLVYRFSHALTSSPAVNQQISSAPMPASVLSYPR
ncbi:unnamed protein product [Dovyalis caffra]|uniref:non-specific serine/threonine protein kinase n=1 Tax=Dovyalis caffra TaxID=77055 RepID=A0AAV1SI06_9ROSI|nr:unnamed protein product [Dovyalis caffra]